MTDISGAGLIGLFAALALSALVRWSERPPREPSALRGWLMRT